jgi:hypothetical protein
MPDLEGSRPKIQTEGNCPAISAELVRSLADKVYALLVADLAIERERQRLSSRTSRFGRHSFKIGDR